jgi:hypothetical protein
MKKLQKIVADRTNTVGGWRSIPISPPFFFALLLVNSGRASRKSAKENGVVDLYEAPRNYAE